MLTLNKQKFSNFGVKRFFGKSTVLVVVKKYLAIRKRNISIVCTLHRWIASTQVDSFYTVLTSSCFRLCHEMVVKTMMSQTKFFCCTWRHVWQLCMLIWQNLELTVAMAVASRVKELACSPGQRALTSKKWPQTPFVYFPTNWRNTNWKYAATSSHN